MTTTDILDIAKDVTAALATLDNNLPTLHSVCFYGDAVTLSPIVSYRPWFKLVPLLDWADAFGARIEISLSYISSGEVTARFELGGRNARITESINTAHAYELGAELGLPLTKDKPITITADTLRAIINARIGDKTATS